MFALIYNNEVIQLSQSEFEVASPLFWVPCDDGTEAGARYNAIDGTVTSKEDLLSLEEVKASKLGELAAYRYSKEVGGVTYNSMHVDTSRDSQAMLVNARALAKDKKEKNLWFEFDLKAKDGWHKINCDQMISVSDKVLNHVQKCFSQERKLAAVVSGLDNKQEILNLDFIALWKE